MGVRKTNSKVKAVMYSLSVCVLLASICPESVHTVLRCNYLQRLNASSDTEPRLNIDLL
jgi:hypothetical protein